jgi:hypothetical protein
MTPVDEALALIRAEKALAKLPLADQDRVLAGLPKTKHHIERMRQEDRFGDRGLRLRNRKVLAHLAPILRVLDDDVGWFDAEDWLVRHHRGDLDSAMYELKAFCETGQRLLAGSRDFDPGPSRAGRGEPQLRVELVRQAFFELIELVESVGVRVGATGGKGGPGSRLLVRLISYAVGFDVGAETVKDLVQKRRQRK